MLMTVLMADAREIPESETKHAIETGSLENVLFVDDTLDQHIWPALGGLHERCYEM